MQPIALRRILCPIDFGDGAQRTVEGAAIMAAMYDAELRLLHVVDGGAGVHDPERLLASLFALTRTLPGRTRISAALAHGDPSPEIIQHARLMSADMIVLRTARRTPPAAVRATILADVCAHAPCPVLIVRPHLLPSRSNHARPFSEIVCCVDPLAGPFILADYAHALARHADARVTLLNVLAADDDMSAAPRDTADHTVPGSDVVHVSLTGPPDTEIVALAKRIDADLIVIGAQDEASERPLGSTAASVLREAPCAVLVVPCASNGCHMTSHHVSTAKTVPFLR